MIPVSKYGSRDGNEDEDGDAVMLSSLIASAPTLSANMRKLSGNIMDTVQLTLFP